MFSDLRKSASSIFEERITSPFFGSFIFSWLVWNWRIPYLTFFVSQDSIKPFTKIEYIVAHYNNWLHLVILPFVSAVLLVATVPYLSNRLFKIHLYYERERTKWREEENSKRRLSIEQSAQIQNDMFEQDVRHQKQLESKDNDIRVSKEQIATLSEEKLNLQERLNIIDEENKKFKIFYARYGKNETFVDVTDIVSSLVASNKKFLVKNDQLGGDPLPGVHKELFVLYNSRNVLQVLSAKEHYEIQTRDELLVANETDESKVAYHIEEKSEGISLLEYFFPGRWQKSFTGKFNGSEEVEIKEGHKYFAKPSNENLFKYCFDLTDVSIDSKAKRIEFTKTSVLPDARVVKSVLEIVEPGKHYIGTEENGEVNVDYNKIE